MTTPETIERMKRLARAASEHAYAPYSRFSVGAACLGGSGAIFAGANVENASYGLTMCAERNAVFQAVTAGEREILAIVIHTPTPEPVTPCGACRQVMCEFGDSISILSFCEGEAVRTFTSGELLPERFRL